MQILRLNNIGRKFPKLINTDEFLNNKGSFRNFRLQSQVGDFWALRNIYMSIDEGEIVGVIGRNGAGKTTLLNIIAGNLPVSEGEVILNGRVSALLTLGAGFQEEFTGRENIYLNASLLGLKKQEIDERFMSILEFSELGDFINAPLGGYSNGMKMRLGFSIAIHNDFDILVTDEIMMVGDIYFQKKCLERMMEFKRQGKSMLIVTHDMNMIEKFCDRAYLLEDGRILFNGVTKEATELYEMLLSKKKILSECSQLDMVKETKRWATDLTEWGKKVGTGEVIIKKIIILNKWRRKTNRFKSGERIIAKVYFEVEEEVDNFHFGVAIFREDGVYCYGPNTKFDGLSIKRMGKGEGYFELKCKELLLMPGVYYLSVAIWDENETLAYDYHICNYKIEIIGTTPFGQLLCLPCSWRDSILPKNSKFYNKMESFPNLDCLVDKWGTELESDAVIFESVKCLDNYGSEDGVFITGRDIKIKIDFKINESLNRDLVLWLGIYRSDGIYCHGGIKKITSFGTHSEISTYPKLRLLPGGYRISAGIWDPQAAKFLSYSHGIHSFNMIFQRKDHGTVYLDHRWNWNLPKGKRA